jgi:eukaryotic-like serine/threonine-protein kinase
MRPELRFRPIASLGTGAHARVLLAYDRLRRMQVAIKRLHQPDPDGLFRLKQEFRAARDLSHPNLVQVYDLIECGSECLFTMEPVFGVDLGRFARERLAEGGLPGALRPIAQALQQLLAAMQAVHDAGMVHRDIKPSNVLVGASGRVVLLDFGLAAPLPEEMWTSDRGQLVGTVAYLAPECLWGAPPTVTSDWYALGAVMAELVLGGPLFSGSVQALLRQKDQPPASLSHRVPGLPPALDRLICGLLAARPDRRPGAAQIAAVLGSLAPAAPRPASPRPAPPAAVPAALDTVQDFLHHHPRGAVVRVQGGDADAQVALAGELLRRLAPAALVLRGRCHPREQLRFGLLDELVDQLSRCLRHLVAARGVTLPPRRGALDRMFPVMARVPRGGPARTVPVDGRPRPVGAAAELGAWLALIARHQRLVVWLEDLQAADADSLAVVRAAIGARRPAPVTWLLADGAEAEPRMGVSGKTDPLAPLPRLALPLLAVQAGDERRRRTPIRSGRQLAAALDKADEEVLVNRRRQLS